MWIYLKSIKKKQTLAATKYDHSMIQVEYIEEGWRLIKEYERHNEEITCVDKKDKMYSN